MAAGARSICMLGGLECGELLLRQQQSSANDDWELVKKYPNFLAPPIARPIYILYHLSEGLSEIGSQLPSGNLLLTNVPIPFLVSSYLPTSLLELRSPPK